MLQGASLLAAALVSGGYGQFAQQSTFHLQTIELSSKSFHVAANDAPEISISKDQVLLGATRISRFGASFNLSNKPGYPVRLIPETTSVGFSMECRGGMHFSGVGPPPFLTWDGGSVGPGVPAPTSKWLIVSWQKPTPPLLLCFSGQGASAVVNTTTNGYDLAIDASFTGIIRVRTPFGTSKVAASRADQLAALVKRCQPSIPKLAGPAPTLVSFKVNPNGKALVGTWQFDLPGAVIPAPLVQAAKSKQIEFVSETEEMGAEGSGIVACKQQTLSIRLFARSILPGCSITSDQQKLPPLAVTLSPLDYVGITELAMSFATGTYDGAGDQLFEDLLEQIGASEKRMSHEKLTGLPVVVAQGEKDATLLAAYGLADAVSGNPENSYVSSLASVDWVSLLPFAVASQDAASAGALLSVALAFSDSMEERFIGALINASLVGRRVSGKNPFYKVRSWIYPSFAAAGLPLPDWMHALQSPVKFAVPLAQNVLVSNEGELISMNSKAGSPGRFRITLFSDAEVSIASSSPSVRASIVRAGRKQSVVVDVSSPAPWKVTLRRFQKLRPFPKAAPGPRYNEAPR